MANDSPAHETPYDPYAPEIVRKMAIVALVCAIAGFLISVFFGFSGFVHSEEYAEKIRRGEVIYANAFYAGLLDVFGPLGVLVFNEVAAVGFLALGAYSLREWSVMRTGQMRPQSKAPPTKFVATVSIVGALGVIGFLG